MSSETLSLTNENVEKVLDELRPFLISDGGNVEIAEIDGPIVKVRLQGACGSCPSSTMTRKMGIESKLKEKRSEYYDCLRLSIGNNDLSVMVEFVLNRLNEAFDELLDSVKKTLTEQDKPVNSLKASVISSDINSEKGRFHEIRPYFTTRENILALLQEHPEWSAARLSEVLGISDRAVEKHISKLKSRGQLKRVGSARGGYWRVVAPLNEQLGLLQGDN